MWCVTITLHTAQRGCPWSGQTYCNSLCTICSNCMCLTVLLCKMQRSCSKHQVSSSCMSILHPVMPSDSGSAQTHGLPGDTFTSPGYSTDSEDSQSHTSSEEFEEETKYQGSKVSNARPFTHKSLVTTHQDVTCAFFSPTMQVPSAPARAESDPHEELEPAAVKGECSVAVCLSMLPSVCPCWFSPPI